MRFVVGLLVVALGGSIAAADRAKPATPPAPPAPAPVRAPPKLPPLRVVGVMMQSHQVLLFDRDRGTHVLAEVGTQVDGFRVDDISDEAVTLSQNNVQLVLAVPTSAPTSAAPALAPAPALPKAAATPENPYDAPTAAPAPADPYADAPTAPAAPADPYADASPSPSPSPSPVAPAATVVDLVEDPALTLTRKELSLALSDFSALASGLRAAFTPTGLRVDGVVAHSLFARAGLRAGDVITGVDGQPLRSLDDAAELYARASSARNIWISVLRAGKPASLHVTIK